MKLGTGIGFSGDPARLARHARDLESAGIDRVWGGEIYGFDLVSVLAYLAGQTERLELMTGILPIYSRSPALIAQTAATIDTLSGGRFVLGLGTSGPQVIEGWHGVPFAKPLARTRDTIEICRKVWSGDRVTHEGKAYSLPLPEGEGSGLGKPLKFVGQPHRRDIPIVVASIGPKNVELTAEMADGWQPIHFVPDRFEQVWGESLAAGRAKRSDDLGPLEIMAGGPVALGSGPHVERGPRGGQGPHRLLRRRHGGQVQELLQRPVQALRLGRRGGDHPGPVPVGQAGRGHGCGTGRVPRPVDAVR